MSDEIPDLRCTITGCDAPLYLTITSCVPLYSQDPPWPGAGLATYDHADAVTDGWEVECSDGHKVWTHGDQIRAHNATLEDDDSDDYQAEDSDTAPRFRPELLPR